MPFSIAKIIAFPSRKTFSFTMARKPGARLTQRKAKREVAKATRDTKYANQKGGGSNSKRRIGRKRSDALLDLPDHLKQQEEADEDEGWGEPEQVDDDKAIRAFTKKLRQIEELKLRQKKGDALNEEQLAKIASERAILKKIIELTAPVDDDVEPVAEAPPKGRAPKSAKRRRS
jgi:uncharacterized protein with WD repeat